MSSINEAFFNDNKHLFSGSTGTGMSMGTLGPFTGMNPATFNMNTHHTPLHATHHHGTPTSVNMGAGGFNIHSHFSSRSRLLGAGNVAHAQTTLPQSALQHSNQQSLHSNGGTTQGTGRTAKSSSNAQPKQFHCPVCQKCFTQKGNLKTHMMIHTGDKPYACHVCGKSFTQKGNVDTHIKIHTGVKDYNCQSCGRTFTQKGNLKTHIRSVHTKEKPYACRVCGKSFSQKGNMHTHVRTHNKDDRFPCQLCGKTFSQKGNLKTHMQRHAGTLPKRNSNSRRQTTSRLLQVSNLNSVAVTAYAIAQQQALQSSAQQQAQSQSSTIPTSQSGHASLSRTNSGSPSHSDDPKQALSMLSSARNSIASQQHLASGAGPLFGIIHTQHHHQPQQQQQSSAVTSAGDSATTTAAATAAISFASFPRFL